MYLQMGKKWHHPAGYISIRGGWRVAGRQTSILALHKQVRRIQSPVCHHSTAGLNGAGMSEAARKPCKGGGPQWRQEHHPSISVPLKTKTKRFRETWRDQRQVTGQRSSSWQGQVCGELWRSRERRLRRPSCLLWLQREVKGWRGTRLQGSCRVWRQNVSLCHYPPSGDVLVQGPKRQRTAASRWQGPTLAPEEARQDGRPKQDPTPDLSLRPGAELGNYK